MNGLVLEEMHLPDMLDVIHYYYEEDMNYVTVEQAQMAEARRIHVFEDMYETKYNYKTFNKDADYYESEDGDLRPFNSKGSNPDVKPYFPPTDVDPDSYNPFGKLLDAPLG